MSPAHLTSARGVSIFVGCRIEQLREAVNLLRWIPPGFVPAFIRKQAVRKLLQLSAEAFGAPAPSLQGLSYDDSLRAFALFTRDEAEKALSSGIDMGSIEETLFGRAFTLGASCRRWFRIKEFTDAMAAARMLYGFCRIDFHIANNDEICVSGCYFSRYYTGEVCKVIASLDAGLLAGLTGGRRLSFSRRITEGATACIGHLAKEDPE